MAKLNIDQAIQLSKESRGGFDYFKLENDKDVAEVRFAIKGMSDLDLRSVHILEVGGKKMTVDCNGEGCYLCSQNNKTLIKLYLQLRNYTKKENKMEIWERGPSYIKTLQAQIRRYGGDNEFFKKRFEIERNGAKGSKDTEYNFFPLEMNDTDKNFKYEDLPEAFDMDKFIAKKTNVEMEQLLKGTASTEASTVITPRTKKETSTDSEICF